MCSMVLWVLVICVGGGFVWWMMWCVCGGWFRLGVCVVICSIEGSGVRVYFVICFRNLIILGDSGGVLISWVIGCSLVMLKLFMLVF